MTDLYGPELEGVAVKRPKRLFTKNTGLCEVVRRRIGADACPVTAAVTITVNAGVKGSSQSGCYKIRLNAGTPVYLALLTVTSGRTFTVVTT